MSDETIQRYPGIIKELERKNSLYETWLQSLDIPIQGIDIFSFFRIASKDINLTPEEIKRIDDALINKIETCRAKFGLEL